MKRQLCTLVLTGLLATGVMIAQEPGSAPEQGAAPQADAGGMGGHHRGGNMMDPDKRLARMTKRYNLTSDQQSQIKPILQDEQTQMQAMRADTSTSRDDKRAKMQSMHQANTQKIEAAMTDEQKQKYEADEKKMQERRAEHMHGGMGGPGDGGGTTVQQ